MRVILNLVFPRSSFSSKTKEPVEMASVEVKAMVAATEFVIVCLTKLASAGSNVWEKPVPIKENRLAINKEIPKKILIILPGFIIQII